MQEEVDQPISNMINQVNQRLETYIYSHYKSLREAATMCGIAVTTLSNMFNNKSGPSVLILLKLCEQDPALDIYYILTGNRNASQYSVNMTNEPAKEYRSGALDSTILNTIDRLSNSINELTLSNLEIIKTRGGTKNHSKS